MEQEIKVIVLQKGDVLISQIEEVAALDIGQPDCKLISPYSLGQDLELTPWLGNITDMYIDISQRSIQNQKLSLILRRLN